MQTARGGVTQMMPTGSNEANRTILSELVSLIHQVRKSLGVIGSEIAREAKPEDASTDEIFVLDDVTPGYARSYAILRECEVRLSTAVRLMQDSATAGGEACDILATGRSPSARTSS